MGSRVLHDHFFKQAKAQGYVARSAFKLIEIQTRHKVIPEGGRVLDLGCHPGAWLQVACQHLGPPKRGGAVIGVDLKDTPAPAKLCDERVRIFRADARDLTHDFWQQQAPSGFHVVLSDMCHDTLGAGHADVTRSHALARCAWEIAVGSSGQPGTPGGGVLMAGGALVMKLLQGEETDALAADLKHGFAKVAYVRPKATRPQSREVFLVAKDRKPRSK